MQELLLIWTHAHHAARNIFWRTMLFPVQFVWQIWHGVLKHLMVACSTEPSYVWGLGYRDDGGYSSRLRERCSSLSSLYDKSGMRPWNISWQLTQESEATHEALIMALMKRLCWVPRSREGEERERIRWAPWSSILTFQELRRAATTAFTTSSSPMASDGSSSKEAARQLFSGSMGAAAWWRTWATKQPGGNIQMKPGGGLLEGSLAALWIRGARPWMLAAACYL